MNVAPKQGAAHLGPDLPDDHDRSRTGDGATSDKGATRSECNDLEIDDIGIWVLVEYSRGQCLYARTAASTSMFDDE